MMLSRRGRATLLSALVFGTALGLYFLLSGSRQPEAPKQQPAAVEEAAKQGRSLRRQLGELLKPAPPPEPVSPSSAPATHSAGPVCDKCTKENCAAGSDDGCDSIADAADRQACEAAYGCFARSDCVVQGDPIPCWCGKKNMTTCVTDNSGPTQANGPCVKEVFAAAKTSDAPTIARELLNPELPLGRAVRLTSCRGNFCSSDCKIP